MKYINPRFLAHLSKVVCAATSVAIFSPIVSAYAVSEFSTTSKQTLGDSTSQHLIANEINSEIDSLPEPVKVAVLQDISQRTGSEMSDLRVVKAKQQTWADGCLGLKADEFCSQAVVRGWQVVVANQQQIWVYRTDESGTMAKLDEGSTQAMTTTMMRRETAIRQTTSRTTIARQAVVAQRSTQLTAARTSVKAKTTGFSLAIWQPSGNFTDVIARVSFKAKRNQAYLKERFLGDYKYKIKHKAKFVKGLKAGDRVVVRLYDTQNRFLGYSEFECMSANTSVNLILSANPTEYQVVRTVYGIDADNDGAIDNGTTTYDYFTQVRDQQVTFLSSSQTINVSQFQAEGLSTIATNSLYPTSFQTGKYALVRQTMSTFSYNLAEALKTEPGRLVQLIEVGDDDSSIYNLSQMMMSYRDVGVANGIQVNFSDVSVNHWAKDFIAELAALQVIEGFPDGTFRPDEQVTRAQFAAMISQAFEKVNIRNAISFKDVTTTHWAYSAIRKAYSTGFLGVAGNKFNPSQRLSRLEVLLSLARGLNYTFSGSTESILAAYTDAASIRSDVRGAIAALTQRGIVVNYPDIQTLNADKVATRAEVSALIYKALVSTGEVADISSQYAVEQTQQQAVDNQAVDNNDDDETTRRHCNQGIGNGSEGCDPGNSHPHGSSNDEGGRTPGRKR
ncbi:S-layer homology domain-containing protein [Nostoc sp. CENA67]|uniref:S-layer homology domain-containing protein n=1 Tax=Amazonocrinis nigriterrae CENA67 TaxID=2794033 RepID=A0A8J7L7A5_9NOST|nr:S-layer homology domain-containing protein [Amazonocrinis nigriterrae]MBH8563194.1 S-layer homology domain-containing protein [Amazonocrinis nigriterrae CENA67]